MSRAYGTISDAESFETERSHNAAPRRASSLVFVAGLVCGAAVGVVAAVFLQGQSAGSSAAQLNALTGAHPQNGKSDTTGTFHEWTARADAMACTELNAICLSVGDKCSPTASPSSVPSMMPFPAPTGTPTLKPSAAPSMVPIPAPSASPSVPPSASPSAEPSLSPVPAPSAAPVVAPTASPSAKPSPKPSAAPVVPPTPSPSTAKPSPKPTAEPSMAPFPVPTAKPSPKPSATPSMAPTPKPTATYSFDFCDDKIDTLDTVCGSLDFGVEYDNRKCLMSPNDASSITFATLAKGVDVADDYQASMTWTQAEIERDPALHVRVQPQVLAEHSCWNTPSYRCRAATADIDGDVGSLRIEVTDGDSYKTLAKVDHRFYSAVWYTMIMRADGNTLTCHVIGEDDVGRDPSYFRSEVVQVDDSTYTNGTVGLSVMESDVHYFESLTISRL